MHLYEQVIDKQVDEIVYPSKFKRKDRNVTISQLCKKLCMFSEDK